jgi:hypothetical protein
MNCKRLFLKSSLFCFLLNKKPYLCGAEKDLKSFTGYGPAYYESKNNTWILPGSLRNLGIPANRVSPT